LATAGTPFSSVPRRLDYRSSSSSIATSCPGDSNGGPRIPDSLIKDNNFHISGDVAYSLPQLDVFGSYVHFADGTDTHAGRAISFGVSWPFQIR
jgi:hypothetical protein